MGVQQASRHGTAPADYPFSMHATFFQKVIICAVLGFFAACLLQWGKVFVTGADEALNGGYKHTGQKQLGTAPRK